MLRCILLLAVTLILSACASGHTKFYKSYADAKTLTDVQTLSPNDKPQIFASDNLARDIKIARSKGYLVIGESSFNGEKESDRGIIQQSQQNGAVMVIFSSKFAETRTITTPLFLPNNKTTYSSGTVNGTGGSANYSGSSTTYGTTVVPITTEQQRYNQAAIYFVKSTKKPRVGLFVVDLTPEIRKNLERNTGVIVDIVSEESPAFIANILPGDIIIEINGATVINTKHALELLRATTPPGGKYTLKIIRNGTERLFDINLPAG
ncbi:PDZ domain-containing protein [Undibacterium pigrum]|uniref:PDZ domain-containing protein n=1 Tax=Undibacterium pigrum TaxID=401470 RepID=A0A318JB82_9BURK|nr:PDZ domain-containing protein [Undibacterium pigrum]PXX43966.1 PDZ domain-containing protein [Undibacterium pigrum]